MAQGLRASERGDRVSVTNRPILPRTSPEWATSDAQRTTLDELGARYPGAHFQAVMYWPESCALVVEWYQAGDGGEFLLAPNGKMLARTSDLSDLLAGQPDVPVAP